MLMFINSPVMDAVIKGSFAMMNTLSAVMLFLLMLYAVLSFGRK